MEETKQELYPGMTSEEIKALFFDSEALVEPDYKIYQLNSEGYRYYYKFNSEGVPEFYPSVTTLLCQVLPTPKPLLDWMIANGREGSVEKRDMAAAYGTFMHSQFEKLILNRRYDFDEVPGVLMEYMIQNNIPETYFNAWVVKIRKDVLAFAQFLRDYNVKPMAVEIGLVHPEYKYAGCLDLPCWMTDPKTAETFTALVDFKSGRKGFYEEHELQLHLYKEAWNVNFEKPIQRVFNFSPKDWRTRPTYNLKDQTDSPSAKKLPYLLALAAIADEQRDNTMVIIHGQLDLDKGKIVDNILTLSLADLIKSKSETKESPTSISVRGEDLLPDELKKPQKEDKTPEVINTPAEKKSAKKEAKITSLESANLLDMEIEL